MRRGAPQDYELPAHQAEALLAVLGEARKALILSEQALHQKSVQRAAFGTVVKNIDEIAALLTGDREHFSTRPSSTPPGWKAGA
jgi:hypothetical protein